MVPLKSDTFSYSPVCSQRQRNGLLCCFGMQDTKHTNSKSRRVTLSLESPKTLYDTLLFRINANFGEAEKDAFEFWFRSDLPNPVRQTRKPLKWFHTLEQQLKLSWRDIDSLATFFSKASFHHDLLSDLQHYQARIRVVVFFQKNLQERLPEICLDEIFNQKLNSEQTLPKRFLKKSQELLRGTRDANLSTNKLRCCFSKGVIMLVDSFAPHTYSHRLAGLKVLYLADLFYKRFKETLVDDKKLLNIEPLQNGRFIDHDRRTRFRAGRRRESTNLRRRSSQPDRENQYRSQRRSSISHIFNMIRFPVSLFFGFIASWLGMFRQDEAN